MSDQYLCREKMAMTYNGRFTHVIYQIVRYLYTISVAKAAKIWATVSERRDVNYVPCKQPTPPHVELWSTIHGVRTFDFVIVVDCVGESHIPRGEWKKNNASFERINNAISKSRSSRIPSLSTRFFRSQKGPGPGPCIVDQKSTRHNVNVHYSFKNSGFLRKRLLA